jgi:ParB family chromosome partitioning protein
MADTKRPALGKGLSALIPDAPAPPPAGVQDVDIDLLAPNTHQPRLQMDESRLEDLARSIKAAGVIQPIVVRKADQGYRIIAGERRWRAARRAGLARVPIVVRDVEAGNDRAVLEMALIENIQREDLNAMEEASAYRRLAEDFQLTQDAIASAVGKDRSTVANTLRLLRLPEELQHEVSANRLSMGHARALLALEHEGDQLRLGRDVIARALSVRETEALVKRTLDGALPRSSEPARKPDVHTRAAEDALKLKLGTRVRIVRRGKKGRIEIEFVSEDELIRIYELLS